MNPLDLAFMQRALLAALFVGLAAPSVGTYLVQRRMALMGDGIGHVALTGVALGFLLRTTPVLTAVVTAAAGAVAIELVRERGRTSGDVALALLFYGGIAGGVLLIGLAPGGGSATLLSYLFGSVTSVSTSDIAVIAALTAVVLAITLGMGRQLFAAAQDEEYARVCGLPVRALNLLVAVTAAVTVTVAMRVVGLLLVSALMVVPVATAQQLTRGFRTTVALALVLGVAASLAGVMVSYYFDVAPGAAIVVLALAAFLATSVVAAVRRSVRTPFGRSGDRPPAGEAGDDVAVPR
ncbi:MAG: metal ABC transporter permease [Carbonactinosporaceae bacterium]